MASIKFDEDGSGANHRCLPRDPEFDAVVPGIQDSRGKIWGAQFEKLPSDPQSNLDDRTVTCAVCRVKGARKLRTHSRDQNLSRWVANGVHRVLGFRKQRAPLRGND